MKAVYIMQPGGPENFVYGDRPDPQAGPGEIVVRVTALNHADLGVHSGRSVTERCRSACFRSGDPHREPERFMIAELSSPDDRPERATASPRREDSRPVRTDVPRGRNGQVRYRLGLRTPQP
jgi:hypothetical protein